MVELLVVRCAGLDVAKDEVVACVRVPDGGGGRAQEVRTFQTFTSGLEALAAWLARGEGSPVHLDGGRPARCARCARAAGTWSTLGDGCGSRLELVDPGLVKAPGWRPDQPRRPG
jgi:hypothetical protein